MNIRFQFLVCAAALAAHGAPLPEPKFHAVTIDDKIQIGYGLAIADVDGDGLPDILLADKRQFVWYRNPGKEHCEEPGAWRKYVLAENLTEKDNVCIAAQDIDGDGKCEIAVGAGWNPADTENSGAVFYLIPPADRTQPWQPVKLHAEPTTHRMGWVRIERATGDAGPAWGLVVVPLHGRGNKNGEGAGVKVFLYRPPARWNDASAEWSLEPIEDKLHMMHGFALYPDGGSDGLILSGKEGIRRYARAANGWSALDADLSRVANVGKQGVGEVRQSKLREGASAFLATVEPMHGNRLEVYGMKKQPGLPEYGDGVEITARLSEGHALACGDLLGSASDQIVVGWRGKAGDPSSTTGLSLWAPAETGVWTEHPIDPDGMACEDLKLADLNGDGKLDIVAAGRATKNVKIYFNDTAR